MMQLPHQASLQKADCGLLASFRILPNLAGLKLLKHNCILQTKIHSFY